MLASVELYVIVRWNGRNGRGRCPYEGDPFDFLAAYLIPVDMWYIIPAERFSGQGSIALYPQLKKSKYGSYKEAWYLLRGSVVDRIEACAAQDRPARVQAAWL